MGMKARIKRIALGDKYIGKHGNKLKHKNRHRKNRIRKSSRIDYSKLANKYGDGPSTIP